MKSSPTVTIAVKSADLRLRVPRHVRRPWRFFSRAVLAVSICASGAALALRGDWRLTILGVVIEGLVFAHMLELVHSCIHGTAFGTRRADRIAGVLLGLPMLVSFSDYRKNHLVHHRTLGKTEKKDFFGYEFEGMTTWLSFARHLLMLGHYRNAGKSMARAVTRWRWWRISAVERSTHVEQILMVMWLLVPVTALLLGHTGPLIVLILPCLIAIPCHVLIELPEHWRCAPVDDPLIHTRSISASRIATWLSNGNNYHLEHHLCPWLSNAALRDVHLKLRAHAAHSEPSYVQFYLRVVRSLRLRGGDTTDA